MAWKGDPMATINEALKLDPEFVMGHCLNVVYHCFAGIDDIGMILHTYR